MFSSSASFFSGTRSQTYKLDTPPVHSHRNEKKRQRTPTPQAKCGLQIHRKHEIGRNKGPRSRVSPSAAEDISSRVTFQDELDFTVRIEPSHLVTHDPSRLRSMSTIGPCTCRTRYSTVRAAKEVASVTRSVVKTIRRSFMSRSARSSARARSGPSSAADTTNRRSARLGSNTHVPASATRAGGASTVPQPTQSATQAKTTRRLMS